ncbi:MAG TPA: hypothetical protein VFZ91_06485 [Allosphingosinicella sp.]
MFPGGRLRRTIFATAFGGWAAVAQAGDSAGSEAAVLSFRPAPGSETRFLRHVYFHKPGIRLETARADIAECRSYAGSAILYPQVPARIPVEADAVAPEALGGGGMTPLVAQAALGIFGGPEQRKIAAANMRKCMGFKGYRRYGLSEPLWEWLNDRDPSQAVERQARVAAGPAPAAPGLDP